MLDPKEDKMLSVDEFIQHAEDASSFLKGYISYDSADPQVILFGLYPFICPSTKIAKDLIEGIRLGSSHPCGNGGQMWDATVFLKGGNEPTSLARLVASLAASAQQLGTGQMPFRHFTQGIRQRCDEFCPIDASQCTGEMGHGGKHYCGSSGHPF